MKEGKSKPKRKYITVYTFLMTQKMQRFEIPEFVE
jgi:hypothetical protein